MALPHAAALFHMIEGQPCIEFGNKLFRDLFGNVLREPSGPETGWADICRNIIKNFASSGQDKHIFEIERDSPIGVEAFACSLGWVRAAHSAGDRILLNVVNRTADRRVEENLRRELVSDTLTSLPNRIGFGEAVEEILERPHLSPDAEVMVMIVDLVRFSRINESLGSMAGDELILSVAKRLKEVKEGDLALARLGGDEFALCMVLTNGVTTAIALAERIKKAISAPVRLANFELSIDCAIGCTILRVADGEADEIIRQAQMAVRTAKRTDRLEIYRPGVLKAARQRFLVESRVRDALANGELHLLYQPLIELDTREIIGFEALARWNDAELGFVSPNDFIPVAEESGLIVQLGRWALNESMQQLARWDAKYGERVPLKMNVNLSPIQIARDEVISVVVDALRMSGVDGSRLTVELTESAIVGDTDNCRSLLAALKGLNVSVAMDDFGTGFSNMASLQSLPIDVLKIDQSFVSNMLIDKDKYAIICAILSLAEALKLRTTAEGIETPEVADALQKMGCSTGQGYHFARALSADDAYDYWLKRWNFEAI
ncbi:MAG: bifunctional diguanylate cyclase/phosphodiesterase [Sphingobium sp.]